MKHAPAVSPKAGAYERLQMSWALRVMQFILMEYRPHM